MESERVKNLREALKFAPNNIPLIVQIANELISEGQINTAIEEYKNALSIEPSNLQVKQALAKAYYKLENYPTAIIILEELCGKTESIENKVLLAKAYLKEGSHEDALHLYSVIIENDPTFSDDELDAKFRVNSAGPSDEDFGFEDDDESDLRFMEKPDVNFDNVGGMERVKREIDLKIIQPLKNVDLYKAYGKKVGGGILLYGPPGCGKTHLARATAGQINAKFINVGISDILDMWIGNSEKNLHEIFEYARRNKPCVLFFDEIDALGASRNDMKNSAGRHIINQFLSELDGVDTDNDGLLILGATNTPWNLDTAFRRPGRFDRVVFVDPPDIESRKTILKILLEEKPTAFIDHEAVAKKTPEFSGADLKALVDIAVEGKIEESLKTGAIELLTTKDLIKAAKKHKPTTKDWFTGAKNYALYANESGLYDDILDYLKIKK